MLKRSSPFPKQAQRPFHILIFLVLILSGCHKDKAAFSPGRTAENEKDFDSALEYYKRALQAHPSNADYKIKVADLSFKASQSHVSEGQKLREKGDLDGALLEFEKAQSIDPTSSIAAQQVKKTQDMIAAVRS